MAQDFVYSERGEDCRWVVPMIKVVTTIVFNLFHRTGPFVDDEDDVTHVILYRTDTNVVVLDVSLVGGTCYESNFVGTH